MLSRLDGHAVFGSLPLSERPYHCLWGDGAELSETELEELRAVYDESTEYIRLSPGDANRRKGKGGAGRMCEGQMCCWPA